MRPISSRPISDWVRPSVPNTAGFQAAGRERHGVAGHEVDTAGARIQAVGEVRERGHLRQAEAGQQRAAGGVGGNAGRQRDAVIDVDLVRVDGDVQAVDRLQHQAQAVGGGGLGLQRRGAQCLCSRAGGREGAALDEHAVGELAGHCLVALLRQRRCTEAAGGGCPQRDLSEESS
ncbi:hypothetical protein G6F40_015128 [Rhizopus arrhizus]|nr:hypothetical protein G6F40_015128 [Rhizopus arrhizus]